MEELPEFKKHVERLLTPLKPGLEYVRTIEFIEDDFEAMECLDDLSPLMLERARREAVRCVDIVERDMMDQIYDDAVRYMEENGAEPGWNAANLAALQTNLAGFCDINMERWERVHFPAYKNAYKGLLDEAGFEYVRSFIGSALAAIPYHVDDFEDSIYYDSDSTQRANDEELSVGY